jgi:hypothetical protein
VNRKAGRSTIVYDKEEYVMRTWMMLGVGALMLIAMAVPGGVWGASLEDVYAETAKMGPPHLGKMEVWVPLVMWQGKAVSLADLCVSGSSVRRKGGADPGSDMGKMAPGNEYDVLIVHRNPIGDLTVQSVRHVSLSNCQ